MKNIPLVDIINVFKQSKSIDIRLFLKLFKNVKFKIVTSIIFFLIKSLPIWIIPIIASNIINISSNPSTHALRDIGFNLFLGIIIICQNLISQSIQIKYLSEAVRTIEYTLRSAISQKIYNLSPIIMRKIETGRLHSKLTRDIEAFYNLSMQFYTVLIPAIVTIIIGVCLTIFNNLYVAVFFVITIPITCILIILSRKKIQSNNEDFHKENERLSSKIFEMLNMFYTTKAHGLESIELKKHNRIIKSVKSKGFLIDVNSSLFASIGWISFQLLQISCISFTGFLACKGKITVGEIALYQVYFSTITNQIINIVNFYPIYAKGMRSVKSLGEVLLQNNSESPDNKIALEKLEGNYNLENVSYSYPGSPYKSVKNLNMKIKKGQHIYIVGESGSGKSTILNLIIGFCTPDEGKIEVDNYNFKEINFLTYRNKLAVVSQNTTLISGTLKENLTYGLKKIDDKLLKLVLKKTALESLMKNLPNGLNTKIEENGSNLSGGQRQKIAIARAILKNPDVVVLDEPTSSLDNNSELEVKIALKELILNKTAFIVTHRLNIIQNEDIVLVMENGECVEMGKFKDLIERKQHLYNLREKSLTSKEDLLVNV